MLPVSPLEIPLHVPAFPQEVITISFLYFTLDVGQSLHFLLSITTNALRFLALFLVSPPPSMAARRQEADLHTPHLMQW